MFNPQSAAAKAPTNKQGANSEHSYDALMKTALTAMLLAAALTGMTVPATAHAECGEPGQDPCTGPVPTIDQVLADMAELTDPNIPAINKGNVVTPGFSPEEAATIDDHLNRTNAAGDLPYNFVVTDIVPAPANFAGATVATNGWNIHMYGPPGPIVLVDESGHWKLTHHSAMSALDAYWYNATLSKPFVPGNSR
jgi:hypothetical protein